MATPFIATVKPAGQGGDYTSLSAWEAAINDNLTSTSDGTKAVVLSHGGITGTIEDGSDVIGLVSGATGKARHVTATQIMIGASTGTFQTGEQIYKDAGTNFVTSSSGPDSVIASCEIDGTWGSADNTALAISGWTVGASNYVNIYTTSTCRHPGYYSNASPYYRKIGNAGGASYQVQISASYTRLTGFIVYNNYAVDGADRGVNISTDITNTLIDKMIVMGHGVALRNNNYSAGGIARNSIILSTHNLAVYTGLSSYIFYNCVAVAGTGGGTTAAFGAGSVCTNCYAHSVGGAGYADGTPTTSASSDGSRSTTTVAYSTSSGAYFTNVTAGSEDFHIGASSALKDAGTADIFSPAEDIDGDTRTGTWDIGADEYVAAGGGSKFPFPDMIWHPKYE